MLDFQRECKSIDDGSQNLQQLRNPIMSLRLINETEENVIDASPDGGAQVQELSIYPVKSRLEEISFPGVFRIE